jgi:MFS transporter, DHA3 family, tetracycline resistance protein
MHISAGKTYRHLKVGMSMLHWMCFAVSSLYYIQIVHMTPLQLVLTGTTLELSVFLLELPTGMIADVFGRRISILIGLLLNGLGFLLQGLWPAFVGVLLAQVLWGAGYTFTSGASEAWITDETDEDTAAGLFLKAEQQSLLGAVLGICIGMGIGLYSYTLAILISACGFFVLLAYIGLTMQENGYQPQGSLQGNPYGSLLNTFKDGLVVTRHNHNLLWIFAVGFIFGFYSEGVDRMWEARMVADFTFPLVQPVIWFGLVQITGMLLGSLSLGIAQKSKKITDLSTSIYVQSLLTVGIIIGLFVFAISRNFILAVLMITITQVFRQIHAPFYVGWVNRKLDASVRATVLSMSSLVDAFGQIGGGPLVGGIANQMGISFGLKLCALFLTPVLPIYWFLLRKLNGKPLAENVNPD